MWSDTSRAARVTHESTVTSFWDDAPVTDASAPPVRSAAREPVEPEPRASVADIERDAFTKGYAQGERAGAEAAARRSEATLRRLVQTVDELSSLRTELVHKTERQVVELALAIARRILHRELSLDRELLVTMARVALERLGEHTSATIKLSPEDHALVGAAAQVDDRGLVRIVADPAVSPGGCLLQSDFGVVDLSLDAQLGEMANALGIRTADPQGLRAKRSAA